VTLTVYLDGIYNITATAYDMVGNIGSATNSNILVDTGLPALNFTSPTEVNASHINRTWAQANITIDESSLNNFTFNWNGANYTIYDDSLVLALNFNNNSAIGENSSTVVDVSKYSNNGTCYNGTYPYCNWTNSGKYGSGIVLDGANDYINVNDTAELNMGDTMAIMFWFKPNQTYTTSTPYAPIVSQPSYYDIAIRGGYMVFTKDQNNVSSTTSTWTQGQWYHVMATSDGSKIRIYVNGVFQGEVPLGTDFPVYNSSGSAIAKFTAGGDIILKGTCTSGGSCTSPPDGSFVIQNSTGSAKAYVDSSGNLCIEDANCSDYDSDCSSPGDGSFILQDASGSNVAYLNATGNMCLVGGLTESGSP